MAARLLRGVPNQAAIRTFRETRASARPAPVRMARSFAPQRMIPLPSRKISTSKCSREVTHSMRSPNSHRSVAKYSQAARRVSATAPRWICARLDFSSALFAKTNHFEGFFDMQLAGAAFRVAPVVVVDAIGEIRILLNFAEHEPGADGVRRASWNENGVARL